MPITLHHTPADHADVREAEATWLEARAVDAAEAGDRDTQDGRLRLAGAAYIESATLWAEAAERWAALDNLAEARRCASAGASAARSAAATLWTATASSADPF
jgi:hypothetical protein